LQHRLKIGIRKHNRLSRGSWRLAGHHLSQPPSRALLKRSPKCCSAQGGRSTEGEPLPAHLKTVPGISERECRLTTHTASRCPDSKSPEALHAALSKISRPNGGVLPVFGDQREIELLVEAGFTPVEAIRIATLNGAIYEGKQDSIGSIEVGKNADLIVIKGDPSQQIADIENVEIVFKDGIGYDSAKLIRSVAGRYGQY
jgi:hypothetical protein